MTYGRREAAVIVTTPRKTPQLSFQKRAWSSVTTRRASRADERRRCATALRIGGLYGRNNGTACQHPFPVVFGWVRNG